MTKILLLLYRFKYAVDYKDDRLEELSENQHDEWIRLAYNALSTIYYFFPLQIVNR